MNTDTLHIRSLKLRNFRCFEKLPLELHPRLNVFFGENGAGKSSIIDGISIGLWYVIRKITGEKIRPDSFRISNSDILLSKKEALVNFVLQSEKKYRITISKQQVLHGQQITANFKDFDEYVTSLKEKSLSVKEGLPIFVKYHATRHSTEVLFFKELMRSFDRLDCYHLAITKDDKVDDFLVWFKLREDLENEQILKSIRKNNKDKPIKYDSCLQAIRTAIKIFLGFSTFTVDRHAQQFQTEKNGKKLYFNQLSDGERAYLLLVGDIARRLAIANPTLDNPLEGEGIVLIDEIELHLHPKWQRMIIPQLLKTFPNCQFIVTSHSPQVLGEVKPESIWILKEGEAPYHPKYSYGLTSAEILDGEMNAESRNADVTKALEDINRLIDNEQFDEARASIKALANITGHIPAIVGSNSYLTMMGEEQAEIEED